MIFYGAIICFLLTFVFWYLYLLLAFRLSSDLLSTISFPLALITAVFLSLPFGLSKQILERLCNKWRYSRFRIVQNFAKTLSLASSGVVIMLVLVGQFYGPLPEWVPFLSFGLIVIMCYLMPFWGFFNPTGVGVLCFKLFLKDFESESDNADFERLFLGAKKVAKIAEAYNMRISSHTLTVGMTISFLENRKATRKEFFDLIIWMEKRTNQENFKKFRKLVKKYNSVAEKALKEGIKEKAYWTFDKAIEICKVIIIPIAIAMIYIVIQKILEILSS